MSHGRGVQALLAAVLLGSAGCGDGDAARKEPSPNEAPPEGFEGVFNWGEERADAFNLSIEPGGVVRWSIHGCDFGAQGHGRWQVREGKLVLSGLRSEGTVTVARATSFDGLVANGPVLASDGSPTQDWHRGGVCAVCTNPDGGPVLGPIDVIACDDPLLP